MKIVKTIGSHFVLFIFGLTVGSFGMWKLMLDVLNEPRRQRADEESTKKCGRYTWHENN